MKRVFCQMLNGGYLWKDFQTKGGRLVEAEQEKNYENKKMGSIEKAGDSGIASCNGSRSATNDVLQYRHFLRRK